MKLSKLLESWYSEYDLQLAIGAVLHCLAQHRSDSKLAIERPARSSEQHCAGRCDLLASVAGRGVLLALRHVRPNAVKRSTLQAAKEYSSDIEELLFHESSVRKAFEVGANQLRQCSSSVQESHHLQQLTCFVVVSALKSVSVVQIKL